RLGESPCRPDLGLRWQLEANRTLTSVNPLPPPERRKAARSGRSTGAHLPGTNPKGAGERVAVARRSAKFEGRLVPRRGLEPPRPFERRHLKTVRLPIPPSGHG